MIGVRPEVTDFSYDGAAGSGGALACGLMPSGRIEVRPGSPDDVPALPAAVRQRILAAFGAGRGNGVLYLGAAEPGTGLPSALAYWRDIGKAFVARVCGALDPTDSQSMVIPTRTPRISRRSSKPPLPCRAPS